MTEEEVQALRDGYEQSIEKLTNKNRELIVKSKKNSEYSEEQVSKIIDENEALTVAVSKLEKANGVMAKDFEKANATIAEKDGNLKKLLIDDGIAKSLNGLERHKLREHGLEDAINNIKSKGVELVDGVAMVGDKPLNEFIANDWVQDPRASLFIEQNPSVGGGAGGGNNTAGGNVDRSKMTPDQLMAAGRK